MDLRQRASGAARDGNEQRDRAGAQSIQALAGVRHGHCDKLGYHCSPICTCFPRWRRRFVILGGGFLWKYQSETSPRPKGAPIPLDACAIHPSDNHPRCIELFLLRKEYHLRFPTVEDRDGWLAALHHHKQRAIKVDMQHLRPSRGERIARKIGLELVQSKVRRESQHGADGANLLGTSDGTTGAFGIGTGMSAGRI